MGDDDVISGRLYDLFMFWYGFRKARRSLRDYPSDGHGLRAQWDQVWFAKTPDVDLLIHGRFEYMVPALVDYAPQNDIEFSGKIILYDQVVRNVYRNTARACAYDHIALRMAHQWLADGTYEGAPAFAQVTVVLCLIHSEVLEDQQLAGCLLAGLSAASSYDGVITTLQEISRRHKVRVEVFGRLPERARIRGLPLSDEERMFLGNVC